MTRSRSLGRFPVDLGARDRLREAQAAEARAVGDVYAAQVAVDKAVTRRDEAIAAATAALDAANTNLDAARATLIAVSGLERAAHLLGTAKSQLRRVHRSGPQAVDDGTST